jgi:hypothetical protein
MTRAEWDTLEWWEQRLYLEGFEDEGLIRRGDGPDADGNESIVFDGSEGEAARFGLRETTI